jgi:hypothetical protein
MTKLAIRDLSFLLLNYQTMGCFEPFESQNNVKIYHFELFLPFFTFCDGF